MIAREPKNVGESPGPWVKQAACAGMADTVFFPERGDDGKREAAVAKAICAACPVRRECLDFAVATHQIHGIWGGTTVRERRSLRRNRRLRLAANDG